MRHRKAGRKFGRTSTHREAMLRNMVCNLFEHGRIVTTLEKAKESRALAEKCITYAKKGLAAQAAIEDQVQPLKDEVAALKEKLAAASDEKQQLDLAAKLTVLVRNCRPCKPHYDALSSFGLEAPASQISR